MPSIRRRLCALLALPTLALSGCYIVPVAPDGTPLVPAHASAPPLVVPAGAPPDVLTARLYPANEVAAHHGMLTGLVTHTSAGRGRFQLEYRGEVLVGEATRVANDARRGVASAYGPQGTFMSCEYRMTASRQGTGTCTLSTGARYSVHLGG